MEVLITRVLLPLLVVFAILILSIAIVVIYGYLINVISFSRSQKKLRKTITNQVKYNCKEMETVINGIFQDLIDAAKMIANGEENPINMNSDLDLETLSDENGDYVMLYNEETKKNEKHYIKDLLEDTFGKDVAEEYVKKQSKK